MVCFMSASRGKNADAVLKAHSPAYAEPFAVREIATAATVGEPNVRPGFSIRDHRHDHRPEDQLPTDHGDIVKACQAVYRRIGMVVNIIDLMADFASEGLDLIHPVRSQQNFFRKWASKV